MSVRRNQAIPQLQYYEEPEILGFKNLNNKI